MLITIQVFNVDDGDAKITGTPPRKLLVAVGFFPSGQEFIRSRIKEGHDPTVQSEAVREITRWLSKHRPAWTTCIDGPHVRAVGPDHMRDFPRAKEV